ncbi:GlxA family transcriptional regulator [Archangium primigenium]|uniref:GlxA family transcriptional regulator n=1 Tax=[Archangium] primigenium TaxID=2792470 RepID=UPI00195ABC95|nr:helix-turn-helix domain-containing protein [Archangium primigenium]MBM7114627.1 helix-turn-helix domain-containing protein [Archangium primigenium]
MFFHLILEGVADSSLGVALDVVATAAHLTDSGRGPTPRGGKALLQRVVSIDGEPVRSSAGRSIAVDGAFNPRALGPGDVVLLPGFFSASARTVEKLLAREDTRRAAELLAKLASKDVLLAASCSATFVLAASGVLDGRSATTSWWLAPDFARRFPKVSLSAERMVVDEGKVITAGAALAHADLALTIVARRVGPSLPHLVARYLVLDERSSQARYMVHEHLRANDPTVLAIERFVTQNVERQVSLEELARAAHVSSRTLARRVRTSLGMTPQEFVHRLRVRRAIHLLETTHDAVDDIAARVGYADAAAFRRVFRRYTGESPRQFRDPG